MDNIKPLSSLSFIFIKPSTSFTGAGSGIINARVSGFNSKAILWSIVLTKILITFLTSSSLILPSNT